MITVKRFHKTIVYLLIICFLCVLPCSIAAISSQTVGQSGNAAQSLLFGLTICFLCFFLIWKCFRWLYTRSEKVCLLVSLFTLVMMTGVFTALSFSARVTQVVDSLDVMDSALYLSDHSEISTNLPYIKYLGSFRNNYPQILLQSYLIKILFGLGCWDIEAALNHLNVFFLMSAVILTWLIVKDTEGIRVAAKTAVICLLNPYLYLLVNWTYTLTYSLPFMMGILYVALLLRKAKTTHDRVVLGLIEGLLSGVGFLIRPTAVFPLIAALIVWFPSGIKKRIGRERAVPLLCALLSFVLTVTVVNVQVNRKFERIQPMNLPLSYWLMMGSHDNGTWNDTDFDAIRGIPEPEDKAQFAWDKTVRNYKQQGVDGAVSLWFRKMNVLWADGALFFVLLP